jgi:hypothetical protein
MLTYTLTLFIFISRKQQEAYMGKDIKHGQIWLGTDNKTIYYVLFDPRHNIEDVEEIAVAFNSEEWRFVPTHTNNFDKLLEENVPYDDNLTKNILTKMDMLNQNKI